MNKYDGTRSLFTGGMQRRSLLKLFGTSALAIVGAATPALQALAQRGSDEPRDCTPPGIAGKTAVTFAPNPQLPIRTRKSDALLRRIKSRDRWNGGVRIEHGPAEITRQWRPKLRHACIVLRQRGETIGRRLIAGVEEFLGCLLAAPVAVERPDERA